ncbi:FHA domain-containing protein [Engelhardtia mirabilis]|uniref:FHA domain-containing protein n=1 Tax=Engelhardtia mirabilis TaxID=2528011 RepID=A0A518BIU6_9BACT|nr:hypothetical protein Pla133_19730 [Planctomycetes bacterium Pla133]QDV01224.1 hypothetical protein Pla86_19730 [Planctomycetes bacterium Pla86]
MPRLIVDDAGQKKAFRVSKGRLSIGSADSAKLKLTAGGVEPEHAILVVRPEGVQVQVHKPVKIGGQSVDSGEVDLPFGAPLAVGGATITVEADEAPAKSVPAKAVPARAMPAKQAGPAAAAPKAGAARAGAPSAGAAKRGAAPSKAGAARGGARAGAAGGGRQRGGDRGAKKQGLPAWVPMVGVVAALALAVWVFSGFGSSSKADNAMTAATSQLDDGNLKTARASLSSINPAKLKPEQKTKYEALMAELEGREAFKDGSEARLRAMREVDEQLKGLVDRQFKTDPAEPEKVRLLWDRIAAWREDWPMYKDPIWLEDPNWAADMAWIAEQEQKFDSVIAKDAPYNLADAEFRAYYFLDSGIKRYNLVMPVIAAAASNTTDSTEREALEALNTLLNEEQVAYAQERFDKARQYFEEGQEVQSAAILVADIRTLTQPQLVDRAATLLLGFPKIRPILEGYERTKPETFSELMLNGKIAAFVRANLSDAGEEAQPEG